MGHRAYVLAEPRRAWAVYLARDLKDKQAPTGPQTATLELRLPAGDHLAEWVNPRTGAVERRTEVKVVEGPARLASPAFEEDVALRIHRR
ncbi:MAG: hypothetical protein M5U12_06450 [Verrucomicrobia bacterium]|nr:hypothetical protein [Verrucomicrobiota bacterium]